MRDAIIQKLKEIETAEHVRILLAVESGSRAWGFASPDSDYDVRFIYVRKTEDYLKLERQRDVIELPLEGELDVNGWDLQKALGLLHRSNPTLFEWFSSPIVYVETDASRRIRSMMKAYFSVKKSLYHHIHVAKRNYNTYLTRESVKAKKYFYVLRPVLACLWILERGTQPPMLFAELADAQLPEELKETVNRLLDVKMHTPEVGEIPPIDELNRYLEARIEEIRQIVASMKDEKTVDWQPLNDMFLRELREE